MGVECLGLKPKVAKNKIGGAAHAIRLLIEEFNSIFQQIDCILIRAFVASQLMLMYFLLRLICWVFNIWENHYEECKKA